MRNVKPAVRDFIVESLLMGTRADEIEDGSSFLETGVLDSTGVIELVSFLERTFGIKVMDEEMIPENLDSLDKIEAYVTGKLS